MASGLESPFASYECRGYKDVARLGEGSFGCVFLATSPAGQRVALKRLAGTTLPHRVVADMEMQIRAAAGASCVPALLGGFRDQVPSTAMC